MAGSTGQEYEEILSFFILSILSILLFFLLIIFSRVQNAYHEDAS